MEVPVPAGTTHVTVSLGKRARTEEPPAVINPATYTVPTGFTHDSPVIRSLLSAFKTSNAAQRREWVERALALRDSNEAHLRPLMVKKTDPNNWFVGKSSDVLRHWRGISDSDTRKFFSIFMKEEFGVILPAKDIPSESCGAINNRVLISGAILVPTACENSHDYDLHLPIAYTGESSYFFKFGTKKRGNLLDLNLNHIRLPTFEEYIAFVMSE
jgi:hypothetical protein